ncbi:MAG: DUF4412 domain-containing protein [Bryobacteraceae bacterium]
MRTASISLLILAATLAARADFSYTMTPKAAGETMKHYLKGQKMKMEHGSKATIMDFEAQTLTSIDNSTKTYTVTKFSDIANAAANAASGVDVKADIKKTGEKKTINGYEATQVIVTMDVEMPQASQAGMKPKAEIELWVSHDVPGRDELVAFYHKNAAHFPMAAMGGNNPGMQKAMAKLYEAMAELDGVVVEQVVRVKMGSGAGPSGAQMQQMAQARARLEAMAQQGGQAGAAAQQALARMGGMSSGSGNMFETTMDGSGFSTDAIPDSVFAIPAGYHLTQK